VSDYSIRIEVLREVVGGVESVKIVRAKASHHGYTRVYDFVSAEMFPRYQRIECHNPSGVYGYHPWPADWPSDIDYTHPDHEAALVSLATRLAVAEWQRRQEEAQ
jgi:hypothetical protein